MGFMVRPGHSPWPMHNAHLDPRRLLTFCASRSRLSRRRDSSLRARRGLASWSRAGAAGSRLLTAARRLSTEAGSPRSSATGSSASRLADVTARRRVDAPTGTRSRGCDARARTQVAEQLAQRQHASSSELRLRRHRTTRRPVYGRRSPSCSRAPSSRRSRARRVRAVDHAAPAGCAIASCSRTRSARRRRPQPDGHLHRGAAGARRRLCDADGGDATRSSARSSQPGRVAATGATWRCVAERVLATAPGFTRRPSVARSRCFDPATGGVPCAT